MFHYVVPVLCLILCISAWSIGVVSYYDKRAQRLLYGSAWVAFAGFLFTAGMVTAYLV